MGSAGCVCQCCDHGRGVPGGGSRQSWRTAEQKSEMTRDLEKRPDHKMWQYKPGGGRQEVGYLPGSVVFEVANAIFGWDGWTSSILDTTVEWCVCENSRWSCGARVHVKVSLKDGTFHEEVGFGWSENHPQRGEAVKKVLKEATTDAKKRALRLFGNALGLCGNDKKFLGELKRGRGSQYVGVVAPVSDSKINSSSSALPSTPSFTREELRSFPPNSADPIGHPVAQADTVEKATSQVVHDPQKVSPQTNSTNNMQAPRGHFNRNTGHPNGSATPAPIPKASGMPHSARGIAAGSMAPHVAPARVGVGSIQPQAIPSRVVVVGVESRAPAATPNRVGGVGVRPMTPANERVDVAGTMNTPASSDLVGIVGARTPVPPGVPSRPGAMGSGTHRPPAHTAFQTPVAPTRIGCYTGASHNRSAPRKRPHSELHSTAPSNAVALDFSSFDDYSITDLTSLNGDQLENRPRLPS